MRIDAHHHLWRYTSADYEWIDRSMEKLQRDFLVPDLDRERSSAGVHSTLAVQARQTLAETNWLLNLATQNISIAGVVGWAPIASPTFPGLLPELVQQPLLKGLRHVVQAEPSGFLDSKDFNLGIDAMLDSGLVYDILIKSDQLGETARFVDRHPNQSFVLDHLAKPDIRAGELANWCEGIRDLARRPNVCCKLSGMVTEAHWTEWTQEQLNPYFAVVLEAFGPSRLMAGSDWPVLNLACSYNRWWQIIGDWLAPLSATERADIEGGVAARIYRLNPAADAHASASLVPATL